MGQVLKIAIGVALGLITVGVIYFSIAMVGFSFITNKTNELFIGISKQNQDTQLRIETERTRQRQFELQTEREKRAATELQAKLKIEKEEAWKKFYKPVRECGDYTRNSDMIKCGNQHAQARKQFEEDWTRKTAMRNEQ